MICRVVKLALALCLVVVNVYGQPQRGNFDPSNMPKESKITGKIIDRATSAPVEYAPVGVFSMRDSSLISGGVTNALGVFSIENLPYGRFYVEMKFIGYNKFRVNGVMLTPNQKVANIGEIKLEPATTALSEVEIVGNRNPVEYKIDKKIVTIGSNIIAAGGTAVDALENTPSVQVDIEGNVALRGSSSFTVLIDGRPSVLKGSEALQQIPASSIQSIEIITNPSAKYDPEGSAGIINVIMKKQKQAGMNGVVNASTSTNGGYSGDFLFNLRASKINYYIGANYNEMRFKNSMVSSMEKYYMDTTIFEETTANGVFKRNGFGIKGGLDFFLDDKNTISVSGSYRDRSGGREANSQNHNYRNDLLENAFIKGFNDFQRTHSSYEGNVDYIRKFNDNGHQLLASVNYSQGPGKELSLRSEDSTDSNWNVLDSNKQMTEKTTEGGNETELTMKLDYTLPVSETSKLEAGYQGDYEFSEDSSRLFNFSIPLADFILDHTRNNDIKFYDQVQAIYSTYSGSLKKLFDYQVGLRVEYSNRKLIQTKKDAKDIVFEKWDYFPSVHISKKLSNNFQLQTSYSRRIRRPDGRELDPFEQKINSTNIRVGNPALIPEYTNSYELNIQKTFKEAGFVSCEFFHRSSYNLIRDYLETRGDISVQTFRNIDRDYSTGVEGMVNMPLAKWWTLNSSISAYDYRLSGNDTASTNKNSFSWNGRINSMIRLKWGTQIQLMGFYEAPSITAQGTRAGFFFTNIGARQDFFKRKLTFSVQVRDLFGNSKFQRTSEGSNFSSFFSMKRQSQVVTFSLSFKINNYKPEKKERDSGSEMEFDNGGGGM